MSSVKFRVKPAFSLIELLIVITIIGLLAAFVTFTLNNNLNKARDGVRKQDLSTIKNALSAYYVEHGQYPPQDPADTRTIFPSNQNLPSWIPDLVPAYLKTLPQDPRQLVSLAGRLAASLNLPNPLRFLNRHNAPLSPTPQVAGVSDTSYSVPVLVLRYFPTKDGVNLDPDATGMNLSLNDIRAQTTNLNSQIVNNLEKGSTYHGFADSQATPSLDFSIYDDKEFTARVPSANKRPDYFKIFSDSSIGVADICYYVDNLGVKQVWAWLYYNADETAGMWESNMSMGKISQPYWNFSTYGDVSNSSKENDLPTCNHTYEVYSYNYSRGLGEALEDHGHQYEAIFGYIDSTLFWSRFVRPYGSIKMNHCGNVHIPPNATRDYDWINETDLSSDCEDWHPDGGAASKTVDCHIWYGEICLDDTGAKYKAWWFQNFPGKNNNLTYQGGAMKNWWDFIGDFDAAIAKGKSLHIPVPDTFPPTVWFIAPENSSIVSDFVTTAIRANDIGTAGMTSKADFYVDGQLILNLETFFWWWDSKTVKNGAHIFTAKAYDKAGNAGTTAPLTVFVDNPGGDIVPVGSPNPNSSPPAGGSPSPQPQSQSLAPECDTQTMYCYIVSLDRQSYKLWAKLENFSDFEIGNCANPPSANFNHCISSDN